VTGEKALASRLLDHAILVAGVLFLLGPILLMVLAATQTSAHLNAQGLGLAPGDAGARNLGAALSLSAGFTDQITVAGMLKNSLIVALSLAGLTTALSLCAAYALVYFRLPFAGFLFWLTMVTLLLPLESRFVTTFQVAATLGLVNTLAGLILPALALALGTLFFRQLFLSFPDEYLEAAKLDGAGPFLFFRDFILPLAWRRGGAIFVVAFMIGWHQYLWPVILSTGESTYTVVRGIRLIGLESGPGMALAVLTLLPPLFLVVIFQRYFFRALADTKDSF
jgi:sn-glycerol 3-phosphate transport system permease protein